MQTLKRTVLVAAVFLLSLGTANPTEATPNGGDEICYEQVDQHRYQKFTRERTKGKKGWSEWSEWTEWPGGLLDWGATPDPMSGPHARQPKLQRDYEYRVVDTRQVNGDEIPCPEPEPEIDFCDWNTYRPSSGSVAKWLADNGIDPTDCFDWTVVNECGAVTVTLTEYPKVGQNPYRAVWLEGDVAAGGGYQNFPAEFDEDYNDGKVTISWFIVGPEKDYLLATDLPNYWAGTSQQLDVVTDCEQDEGPTPTTQPPAVTVPSTTVPQPEVPETTIPAGEPETTEPTTPPISEEPTDPPVTGPTLPRTGASPATLTGIGFLSTLLGALLIFTKRHKLA